jgi:PAS domain-containing protein
LRSRKVSLTDREGRWWGLRVRPYLTADSRIDGATLVAFDINSVKRNRELSESRDSAHAIVQTVREPIVVLDSECRVELANEAFFRLFDETPAEVEGRSLWEIGKRCLGRRRPAPHVTGRLSRQGDDRQSRDPAPRVNEGAAHIGAERPDDHARCAQSVVAALCRRCHRRTSSRAVTH